MLINSPQDYTLTLADGGAYTLRDAGQRCAFSAPASHGGAKLYTISDAGALLYVGIAVRPMSARINHGLKAAGKGGYYGYKWKGLRQPLALSVWTATVQGRAATERELETVEAEVAYVCRHESGQWPTYQHEIHFHPSAAQHRE